MYLDAVTEVRNVDERQSIKYTNLLMVRYLKYEILKGFLFTTLQYSPVSLLQLT